MAMAVTEWVGNHSEVIWLVI